MRVTRYDHLGPELLVGWDAMWGPRRFYASSGWLRVAADTADHHPFYLLGAAGATRYALPCYPIGPTSPFPFCRVDRVLGRVIDDPELTARLLPSLLLGARNPGHAGFGVAQAPSSDQVEVAVDTLAASAEREASERGLSSVAMLYVDEGDTVTRRGLARRGYQAFEHTAASLLTVPPGGRDGYLAMLEPRDAGTARREMRKLGAAGIGYDTVEPTEAVLAEVDVLERQLNRKYGGTYDDDAVARLRHRMAGALDGLFVARARLSGRTVGSLLAIRWRDEIYARTVGFDYEAIGTLPVYFGLLFYHLVAYAQAEGVRVISYATGTQDAKRRRGCVPIPQYAYVKPLDPALADRLRTAVRRPS